MTIRKVMAEQESAWDRGDLSGFMEGYSDTICFIGGSGVTCGKEEVLENYRENYPDRNAMGDLTFGIHEVLAAGPGAAWVTGTWELHRGTDSLNGGFSLLWVMENGEWRIVRDHSY